jgi:hypothetical protein
MLETTMRKLHLLLKMVGAEVLGALALTFTGQPASAQTTTNQPPVTANPAKKKPTSAMPQMIEEAMQRSQARSAKAKRISANGNSAAARNRSPTLPARPFETLEQSEQREADASWSSGRILCGPRFS